MPPPRIWQRQLDETPPDFTAFVTYLRLKGRRSHRAVAAKTGRSLGAIRRLSARFNWRGRVDAFEARLADASQDALDLLVRTTSTLTAANIERLRIAEFQLAQRVLQESDRWLKLASDPPRREVSLTQVSRVLEFASKLGRLAAGMPTGDKPRKSRKEEPGYWTGPSVEAVEAAIKKIYGSPAPAPPVAPEPVEVSPPPPVPAVPTVAAVPQEPSVTPRPADPPAPLEHRRCDAWSRWARLQREAAARRR
jgi:hypothetical protein